MAPRTRMDTDYYAVLGLPSGATGDEIRRAYRRLALEWHPDRRPGDPEAPERFKEISEAYAVLIDPARRREYDQARRTGAPGSFHARREDLFRDLFADPTASAIFEELAREFERMGMHVDRHYFRHTLFGGRAVMTGGIFIISPLTPVLALFRLARAALRGARAAQLGRPAAPPLPRPGLSGFLGRVGRSLLGLPAPTGPPLGPEDVVLPLRLTPAEAERGGGKPVTLRWRWGPEEVLVTVPPGTRGGTHLRLRGKGKPRPDGTRGDAYLTVEIV